MRRKLAAGNWKMNGSRAALYELAKMAETLPEDPPEVLICPPAPYIAHAIEMVGPSIMIGAQDCHTAEKGAHTGDIATPMIADLGASHVIVGHSERRTDHGESDSDVRAKADAGLKAGLTSIICIGESEAQYDAGETIDVLNAQLRGSVPDDIDPYRTVIAYEPIWAIGTGKTPTLDEIASAHAAIRTTLTDRFGDRADAIRLLYGGSVKPGNASDIFGIPEVDGALVGGASLKADDFVPIITALSES